jgi:hypothetical protein
VMFAWTCTHTFVNICCCCMHYCSCCACNSITYACRNEIYNLIKLTHRPCHKLSRTTDQTFLWCVWI